MIVTLTSADVALQALSGGRSSAARATTGRSATSAASDHEQGSVVLSTTRIATGSVVLDIYKAPAGSQGAGDYFLSLKASNGSSINNVEVSPGDIQAALKSYGSGSTGSDAPTSAALFPNSASLQDLANMMSSGLSGSGRIEDTPLGSSTIAVLRFLAGGVKSGHLAMAEASVSMSALTIKQR